MSAAAAASGAPGTPGAAADRTGEPTLLLATRSDHKLREIRDILGDCGADVVSLADIGVAATPDEDAIEAFDSFVENAIAKAVHFCRHTGLPTVADDSGIVVPALGGRPGVLSRRFAETLGHAPLDDERDALNTALLLREAAHLQGDQRRAYFACVAAIALPTGRAFEARETRDAHHAQTARGAPATEGPALRVFAGTCEGLLAAQPRGQAGFGYDPIFLIPDLGMTFAEVPAALKERLGHRGRAFRALASSLPPLFAAAADRT